MVGFLATRLGDLLNLDKKSIKECLDQLKGLYNIHISTLRGILRTARNSVFLDTFTDAAIELFQKINPNLSEEDKAWKSTGEKATGEKATDSPAPLNEQEENKDEQEDTPKSKMSSTLSVLLPEQISNAGYIDKLWDRMINLKRIFKLVQDTQPDQPVTLSFSPPVVLYQPDNPVTLSSSPPVVSYPRTQQIHSANTHQNQPITLSSSSSVASSPFISSHRPGSFLSHPSRKNLGLGQSALGGSSPSLSPSRKTQDKGKKGNAVVIVEEDIPGTAKAMEIAMEIAMEEPCTERTRQCGISPGPSLRPEEKRTNNNRPMSGSFLDESLVQQGKRQNPKG
ncbi:hypothetical protein VTL71DRAFT_9505 [Oculimacula yallundae]|uniref:Uncharacterized protein n=1 Tax=Oculimacula yallundae TaxID=86028 RepID=A0ABR4BS45_9HELO